MRREFGITADEIFDGWTYWQFKSYLAAIPRVLGGSEESEPPASEPGAIDTSEMDLGELAKYGIATKGPV
mgnify:CR=1 FL=1